MNEPVRMTPTHDGSERRGALRLFGWELEGESYLYLLCGAVAAGFLWLLLSRAGASLPVRLVFSAAPIALAALWLRLAVLGKPPGFQVDWIEGWMGGGAVLQVASQFPNRRHPLEGLGDRPVAALKGGLQ